MLFFSVGETVLLLLVHSLKGLEIVVGMTSLKSDVVFVLRSKTGPDKQVIPCFCLQLALGWGSNTQRVPLQAIVPLAQLAPTLQPHLDFLRA